MSLKPDQRQASATLNRATYAKLERLARARGLSLHAFMQRVLTRIAEKEPEPTGEALRPIDQSAEKNTEQIAVEVTVDMAARLFSAAHQMRDLKKAPLDPAVLARMILMDHCETPSNLAARIEQETDPAYVPLAFTGKLRERNYRTYYLLVMRTTFKTKQAVLARAQQDETTVAALTRKLLDDYLPYLPE